MRSTTMTASAPGRETREVFDLLRDFERYPEVADAVCEVTIDPDATPQRSSWRVRFREGLLEWTEEDHIDEDALEVRFEQVTGDFEHLAGRWTVSPADDGCSIELVVEFDVGIPSLSDVINPLAERTLYENGVAMLQGLVGGEARIDSAPPAATDGDLGAGLRERLAG